MVPTYTYEIKHKIIKDYLGANLAVALINNINLGLTDAPSNEELEARKLFIANSLVDFEIGDSVLNGYRRNLISNSSINPIIISPNQTEVSLQATFTAIGGNFNPATHVVVLRGANINAANPITNGNNRGDTNGTIIFIEPINNILNPGTPFILQEGITFNYNFKLINATEII